MKKSELIKYLNKYSDKADIKINNIFVFKNGRICILDNYGTPVEFLKKLLSKTKFTMQDENWKDYHSK